MNHSRITPTVISQTRKKIIYKLIDPLLRRFSIARSKCLQVSHRQTQYGKNAIVLLPHQERIKKIEIFKSECSE